MFNKLEISCCMPAIAACQLSMCVCAYVFRRGCPMISKISNIVTKQIFKLSQGDNDQICHTFPWNCFRNFQSKGYVKHPHRVNLKWSSFIFNIHIKVNRHLSISWIFLQYITMDNINITFVNLPPFSQVTTWGNIFWHNRNNLSGRAHNKFGIFRTANIRVDDVIRQRSSKQCSHYQ